MPLCILRSIQQKANALYSQEYWPVLFWIDTVCVPKINKVPALQAMLRTYQNADVVLVLDASLEAVPIDTPPVERLLRILVSPWTQRLWTLQEGWVAKTVAFQFSGGATLANNLVAECIRADHPWKLGISDLIWPDKCKRHIRKLVLALAVDDSTFNLPQDLIRTYRQQVTENFPGFPRDDDRRLAKILNQSHQFDPVFVTAGSTILTQIENRDADGAFLTSDRAPLFNALRLRTTSRLEDEMYLIASLTGLPVAPVLAVKPKDRMKRLLMLMPRITSTVLFSDHSERLEDEGFRWAPRTFMNIHSTVRDSLPYGRVEGGGFRVSLPGMKLECVNGINANMKREYPVQSAKLVMPNSAEEWLYKLTLLPDAGRQVAWADLEGKKLMMILRRINPGPQGRVFDTVNGALVEHVTQADNVRTVNFLTVVWMQKSRLLSDVGGDANYLGEWLDDGLEWRVQ